MCCFNDPRVTRWTKILYMLFDDLSLRNNDKQDIVFDIICLNNCFVTDSFI